MKYSKFYMPPQEYSTDNMKMRVRIGRALYNTGLEIGNHKVGGQIILKNGIQIPKYKAVDGYVYHNLEELAQQVAVTDLLDIITTIYELLEKPKDKSKWIETINAIFIEEGLAYIANQQGEVRFRPDEEFERNRILTLRYLPGVEFSAVLEAFNHAYIEFQSDSNKGKSALRYMFEANEILFKKLAKPKYSFQQLNTTNIEKLKQYLFVDVLSHLDETAKNVVMQFFESYKKWVDAMHPYRHGQDVEVYDNPPIDITILALSTGASYLRWLASILEIKLKK